MSEKMAKESKSMNCNLKDMEISGNKNLSDLSEENSKIRKKMEELSAAIEGLKDPSKQK